MEDNMIIECRNLIGFAYSKGTGKTFQGVNPTTNATISETFCIASHDDVDTAMRKAKGAFSQFSITGLEERASFLESIAFEIEHLGDVLVQRASLETGLSNNRIISERGRTLQQLHMFAAHIRSGQWLEVSIDTALPDRLPIPKPDLRKMMVSLGPVVVFGASNFPLAYSVAGGDTAAAFAAGCPVIVKAHPGHPGTSALVGKAIISAAKKNNMPDGVFSMLYDSGFTIGQALVEHQNAAAVGFTGSVSGGRALFNIASKRAHPIPVFAEMGSTNPVVLLPRALDLRSEKIAKEYAESITLGVGQFCTTPGLLLAIQGPKLEGFKQNLISAFTTTMPGTMLHDGIEKEFNTRTGSVLQDSNVKTLAQSRTEATSGQGRPLVASTTGKAFLTNPNLHEEVFGPFSLLVECESTSELYLCVEALHGQLTGTLIGELSDFENHPSIIKLLEQKVGRLIFNGVPTGVEVCPSMMHGGPYPATTDARFTAVGIHSIKRFLRPVTFQNTPSELLPLPLKDENPLGIQRFINGKFSFDPIA